MYLHLGQDTVITTKSIIGIFDMDRCTVSKKMESKKGRTGRYEISLFCLIFQKNRALNEGFFSVTE